MKGYLIFIVIISGFLSTDMSGFAELKRMVLSHCNEGLCSTKESGLTHCGKGFWVQYNVVHRGRDESLDLKWKRTLSMYLKTPFMV